MSTRALINGSKCLQYRFTAGSFWQARRNVIRQTRHHCRRLRVRPCVHHRRSDSPTALRHSSSSFTLLPSKDTVPVPVPVHFTLNHLNKIINQLRQDARRAERKQCQAVRFGGLVASRAHAARLGAWSLQAARKPSGSRSACKPSGTQAAQLEVGRTQSAHSAARSLHASRAALLGGWRLDGPTVEDRSGAPHGRRCYDSWQCLLHARREPRR